MAADDTEKFYSQKARDQMDDSDFGDPENQAFPIKVPDDVINAASRLHNSKGDQSAIKARIIRIAKRKGFPLPQTWQDDKKETTESVFSSLPFSPRSKIATLTTCWLEDGAISLNGRQYPREAVDRLIQSAQLQLSNPSAAPLTCYISHDAADQDDSLKLAGKVTGVWREGPKAMASIDIANTSAGRDMATQSVGGYLRTMSLRARWTARA